MSDGRTNGQIDRDPNSVTRARMIQKWSGGLCV